MHRTSTAHAFCLDFDGVLCDSARETGVSAWRAGARLGLWRGPEPPPDALEAFVRLRPVIETGYQCVPLMVMIQRGLPEDRILADFEALCHEVMREYGWSREVLIAEFGAARDEWLRTSPDDWLARHRFFPGVVERLRYVLPSTPVFILTTKQKRFTLALLQHAGLDFPADRVLGLEAGRPKPDLIADLRSLEDPDGTRTWHFVEDRLRTLEAVSARADLADVRLYLAEWGYVTPADLERARALPRIRIWRLDQFLQVDKTDSAR